MPSGAKNEKGRPYRERLRFCQLSAGDPASGLSLILGTTPPPTVRRSSRIAETQTVFHRRWGDQLNVETAGCPGHNHFSAFWQLNGLREFCVRK